MARLELRLPQNTLTGDGPLKRRYNMEEQQHYRGNFGVWSVHVGPRGEVGVGEEHRPSPLNGTGRIHGVISDRDSPVPSSDDVENYRSDVRASEPESE
ncbi:hypothetical protein DPMN_000484 [Dreissena polymorpha]|uniref:Uncharacterized protein n=1 Tax=Dreissena polymorpha TaxID=45954 RepID=A0A9D4MI34_DREPO|nr:hypothetical protein DPMN_000484 [Dreissena polymorpha]